MSFFSKLGRAAKKLAAPIGGVIGGAAGFLTGGPAGAAAGAKGGYSVGKKIGNVGGKIAGAADTVSGIKNMVAPPSTDQTMMDIYGYGGGANKPGMPGLPGGSPDPFPTAAPAPAGMASNPFDLSSAGGGTGGGTLQNIWNFAKNNAGLIQTGAGIIGGATQGVLDQRNTGRELDRRDADSLSNRKALDERTRQETTTFNQQQAQRTAVDPQRQALLRRLMASFGGIQ